MRDETILGETTYAVKERLNAGSTLLREPPCNRCVISIKILDRISGVDQGRKWSARNVENSQAERRTKDGKEERYSSRRDRSIYLPNRLATYRRIRWIYSCLRFSPALRSLGKVAPARFVPLVRALFALTIRRKVGKDEEPFETVTGKRGRNFETISCFLRNS